MLSPSKHSFSPTNTSNPWSRHGSGHLAQIAGRGLLGLVPPSPSPLPEMLPLLVSGSDYGDG